MFVSDASQEFTAPELEFLQTARRMCPNVVCVLTKVDFYPSWRKIRDLNVEHLKARGINAPLMCVSSALRIHALRNNDRDLNQESGFPALVGYLQSEIATNAETLTVRTAASDVLSVTSQLAVAVRERAPGPQQPRGRQGRRRQPHPAAGQGEPAAGQRLEVAAEACPTASWTCRPTSTTTCVAGSGRS